MESIEELRKYAKAVEKPYLEICADEIEAEIEAKYLLLPVDADGVPIKPGDAIVKTYTRHSRQYEVVSVDSACAWWFNESGEVSHDRGSDLKHYKRNEMQDVLERFLADYDHWYTMEWANREEKRKELFDRYAEELKAVCHEIE